MIKKGDHLLIAGLGLEFAAIMCLGSFGGYWLDKKFGTMPVFILICSALAFAIAIYVIVKSAKTAVEKNGKQK